MLKKIRNDIHNKIDELTVKELPQLTVIAAFIITWPGSY